jgi:putative transposase
MTIQNKAYRFRLYPTERQKDFLSNQFGAVRFVYNHFLANRKTEYLNNKKSISYLDDAKSLTNLKEQDGYDWLYEINAQSLQASLRNLEVAYQSFFKKHTKFPRFHKRSNKQSIKIPQHFLIEDGLLYIPKLKTGIKINLHQPIQGKTLYASISKEPSGKYFASFACEVDIKPLRKIKKTIGMDLGIKTLLVASDGQVVANPHFYRQVEKELQYQQRQLSKKQKGSKNKDKQRVVVARLNEWIANSRKNYLHKVSKKLIDENQVIIAESLKVANMMKNHKLAKSIGDASWGELVRQLEYKALWFGRTFYQIGTFFPSSKTCHGCQFVVDSLPLHIREWECPNCKSHNDRDLNASLNIRDKGLLDLKNLNVKSGNGILSDSKQKLVEAPRSKEGRRSKKPRP